MINYQNSKTSLYVEDELPKFIRENGALFIEFLKTYYDWLERKIVLMTLKSDFEIEDSDIFIEEVHISNNYDIVTENGALIIMESTVSSGILDNEYSLYLKGTAGYMDVTHSIFTATSDFSVGFFLNLTSLPSIARQDYDLITLSNTSYLSLAKISKDSDTLKFSGTGFDDIDTGIPIEINSWMYISCRYNSSTKTITYDVFKYSGQYTYSDSLDLSAITTNRFVVGGDLYNSKNFSDVKIDELGTWNKYLGDTEIIQIYNDGTAIDLQTNISNYVSSSNLNNYFRFENDATNSVSGGYDGTLFNDSEYSLDIPLNIACLVTEDNLLTLSVRFLSYLRYDGGVDGVMSDRVLIFAEHLYGILKENDVVINTSKGPILISKFEEAKNPLNVANNLSNFQEIDYVFDYNNFITNVYFQFLWKEIMDGFPLFFSPKFEETIKNIISKNIRDFYDTKGTLGSIKNMFKLIYNEDFDIGADVYADDIYEYTIHTAKYGSAETKDYIKSIVHPVGYKLNLLPAIPYTKDSYGSTWNDLTDSYTTIVNAKNVFNALQVVLLTPGNEDNPVLLNNTNYNLLSAGGASDLTGASGQVMLRIPKFYYSYSYENNTHNYQISINQFRGSRPHPAFYKAGQWVPYRYVGVYPATWYDVSAGSYVDGDGTNSAFDPVVDKLGSIVGKKPLTYKTRAQFRSAAANVGSGWSQMDFWTYSMIKMLYITQYSNFNSQSVLGAGNSQWPAWDFATHISATGKVTSMTAPGQSTTGGNSGDYSNLFGLEDMWGGVWQMVDGWNINSGVNYICSNPANFADDTITNYIHYGSTNVPHDGWQNTLQHNIGFLPTTVGGYASESNRISDFYWYNSGWVAPWVGGDAYLSVYNGLFVLNASQNSSFKFGAIGSRLCF